MPPYMRIYLSCILYLGLVYNINAVHHFLIFDLNMRGGKGFKCPIYHGIVHPSAIGSENALNR